MEREKEREIEGARMRDKGGGREKEIDRQTDRLADRQQKGGFQAAGH